MSVIRVPLSEPRYSSIGSAPGQPTFHRCLWERTPKMPIIDTDSTSSNTHGITRHNQSRRESSVSLPTYQRASPTHSRPTSDTPLTPEETPPFRSGTKRNADDFDQDELNSSPSHSRDQSGESAITFCLCQPEPKVPRPRNGECLDTMLFSLAQDKTTDVAAAFILYRQNHQASVAAHNPGLANPDISKIIGKQWSNESEDEKNRWKAYAEVG